jgi:hypothetical protein
MPRRGHGGMQDKCIYLVSFETLATHRIPDNADLERQ